MPKLVSSIPKYRKHRASGQAIVTLSGQDFYLGPHGTRVSKQEYDRLVAEWLARGRSPAPLTSGETGELTLVELLAAYKRHAELYYRKNGQPTSEVGAIVSAVKVVKEMYGREPVNAFDALKLQAVQQAMIRRGWARKTINKQISRIVNAFAWGVTKRLVGATVVSELREVRGLRRGRTEARETLPVRPVDDSVVNATLVYLSPVVVDMVRLQRLCGMRPSEVCLIRPCDLDTSSSTAWSYRPESHKTEHHEIERVIFIGPRGQDVLRPYLLRDKAKHCFCPAEEEQRRRVAAHEARATPLSCGNRPGTNRKTKPARPAGERYTTASYRRAICRACESAFGMPVELQKKPKAETPEAKTKRLKLAKEWRAANTWHPNQLRHSAATEIRKKFGLEAAQVTLGHAAADVTQVYAERDLDKAAAVMAQVG